MSSKGKRRSTNDRNADSKLPAEAAPFVRSSLDRTVMSLARQYQAYLEASVAGYGISSAHVPLLCYLWEGNSGDTQNEIARSLGVDKGTVSRNIQALVKVGILTQTSSSRDSRACRIELTKQGWDLAEPVTAICSSWCESLTSHLSAADNAAFLSELGRMDQRAEELVAAAHGAPAATRGKRMVPLENLTEIQMPASN